MRHLQRENEKDAHRKGCYWIGFQYLKAWLESDSFATRIFSYTHDVDPESRLFQSSKALGSLSVHHQENLR